MMSAAKPIRFGQILLMAIAVIVGSVVSGTPARAQVTPFMQAVAEAASGDKGIAAFYRNTEYQPIWTGPGEADRKRRAALFMALARAGDHALPVNSYNADYLAANLRQVRTERDLGLIEVELTKTFLKYAHDVQTGVLTPKKIDSGIVRNIPVRDKTELLVEFSAAAPMAFLRSLPPRAPEYARLMKAKVLLEKQLAHGGWGPTVPANSLKPGQSGNAVVALRNRMIAMGYMSRTVSAGYDGELQKAVQLFQTDNGLEADGIAGPGTMQEINRQIEERLPHIIVAMERERWMNIPRGDRHIWVNLTDFSARIVDHDRVTFETRSVIGADTSDRRTPEFSDTMEYMEINPYWNVPRSISVKEYLPAMIASGGGAARHLELVDGGGRVVSRGAVNWSRYSPRSFPFNLRQPPSRGNALGLVKFMFPNRHNIYLHDTPSKSLFGREVRAFSHGCIRLGDPFDFAYALLAAQTDDPVGFFQTRLQSGQNTRVDLEQPLPVHIVYRTAFTSTKGRLNFRRDVYGRDAQIFDALARAGVVMNAARS